MVILVEIAMSTEMAILVEMAMLAEMAILVEMAIWVEMAILAHFRINRCLHEKECAISYRTVMSRASGVPRGSKLGF